MSFVSSEYKPKMGESCAFVCCMSFRRSALGAENVCSCGWMPPVLSVAGPNSLMVMLPMSPLRLNVWP